MPNFNPQHDNDSTLGSSLKRWRKIFISEDASVDRDAAIVRDVTVGRNLSVAGAAITLSAVPAANPAAAGRLYTSSGFLKVSTG